MSKPLVTFALSSYNQERFIREAVRGAFGQTYSPLEIIISDDCSRDRTFDIIREEVNSYTGPHRVLLNRNEHNLGIGGHLNRVMELATGELIVVAAGDDVSLPTRTEEFVRAWSGGEVFSVYSNYVVVDENGAERRIGERTAEHAPESWQEWIRRKVGRGLGCSHAWDRAVFDTFGPLPENVVLEDVAIPFRAALLGKIAFIDECLVKYRRHDANTWKQHEGPPNEDLLQFARNRAIGAKRMKANWESWLRDVRLFSVKHPEMADQLLWAAKVLSARAEFHGFEGSALECNKPNRWLNCLRAIRGVKKLGIRPMIRVGVLGVSPTLYYRVQLWASKGSLLSEHREHNSKTSPVARMWRRMLWSMRTK